MLTNKICARHITTLIYFHIYLSIPNCRSWTSLGNTVFMQIVSSYNYERLIRSISTPFCLPNMYALFLLIFVLLFLLIFLPLYLPPLFILPFSTPLYLYALFILIFVHLYFYSLFSYSLLLSPSICTHNMYAFFRKIFPKKIGTLKAYPKIFPKFLLIIITPPLYSSIGK